MVDYKWNDDVYGGKSNLQRILGVGFRVQNGDFFSTVSGTCITWIFIFF